MSHPVRKTSPPKRWISASNFVAALPRRGIRYRKAHGNSHHRWPCPLSVGFDHGNRSPNHQSRSAARRFARRPGELATWRLAGGSLQKATKSVCFLPKTIALRDLHVIGPHHFPPPAVQSRSRFPWENPGNKHIRDFCFPTVKDRSQFWLLAIWPSISKVF